MPNFQFRGGTASAWSVSNPVLLSREQGVETDTGRFKIGDGILAWNSLPYSSGTPGPIAMSQMKGPPGESGRSIFGLPTGVWTRAQAATDAKGWAFLGTATGATTTVGPVIWTGQFRQFRVSYFIAGYNGGTPVGRLLIGSASISTTALNNGSNLSEQSAAPTSAPSIPGMPLAVTLSNIAREGTVFIDGASGSLKSLNCVGQNGNPSVAAPPTIFHAAGAFSDLGTNLLLLRAQLTVYDTLVATAVSAQTFTSGTYLSIWGRNND